MAKARMFLLIAMTRIGGEMQWRADRMGHLTTDPLCIMARPVQAGSFLDRVSRGLACGECMAARAFGEPMLPTGFRIDPLPTHSHIPRPTCDRLCGIAGCISAFPTSECAKPEWHERNPGRRPPFDPSTTDHANGSRDA